MKKAGNRQRRVGFIGRRLKGAYKRNLTRQLGKLGMSMKALRKRTNFYKARIQNSKSLEELKRIEEAINNAMLPPVSKGRLKIFFLNKKRREIRQAELISERYMRIRGIP